MGDFLAEAHLKGDIHGKVYSIRAGRNLGDNSSNVVLAPSPTPPDEETVGHRR